MVTPPPPVLPTSRRIWTNPTVGPWDKWGDASSHPPRGYATAPVDDFCFFYILRTPVLQNEKGVDYAVSIVLLVYFYSGYCTIPADSVVKKSEGVGKQGLMSPSTRC